MPRIYQRPVLALFSSSSSPSSSAFGIDQIFRALSRQSFADPLRVCRNTYPYPGNLVLRQGGKTVSRKRRSKQLDIRNHYVIYSELEKIKDPERWVEVCANPGFCSVFRPKIRRLHWVE